MTQREEFERKINQIYELLGVSRDFIYYEDTDTHQCARTNPAYMWFKLGWQAAKAQAVPQWISVSERLPEHKDGMWSDPVIAMSDTGDVFRLSYCGGWQRTSSFMDSGSSNVTHWMPLPSAPEQQK